MQSKLYSIVLFLCWFVTCAVALSCYVCDSSPSFDINNGCYNIPYSRVSKDFAKDCETQFYSFGYPYNDSSLFKGCRKFTQKYKGKERLQRGCSREPVLSSGDDCFTIVKTSRSKPVIQTTCICGESLCNLADSVGISILLLGFVAYGFTLFYLNFNYIVNVGLISSRL